MPLHQDKEPGESRGFDVDEGPLYIPRFCGQFAQRRAHKNSTIDEIAAKLKFFANQVQHFRFFFVI